MFVAPAIPTPSLPAANAAAFLANAGTQAALGRLPTQEVPVVLSESQVFSRLRGQGGSVSAAVHDAVENAPDYLKEMIANPPSSGMARNSGFSSPFMAQLLGANADDESGIYLRAYEKLINLSKVRFKPSNAGLTQLHGPASVFKRLLGAEEPAPAANENRDVAALPPADSIEALPLPAALPATAAVQPMPAYGLPQTSTPAGYQPLQLTA